jgi:hypothetical protein
LRSSLGLFGPLDIAKKLNAAFFENLRDVVADHFTIDPGQIMLDLRQRAERVVPVERCHARVLYCQFRQLGLLLSRAYLGLGKVDPKGEYV